MLGFALPELPRVGWGDTVAGLGSTLAALVICDGSVRGEARRVLPRGCGAKGL